MKLSFLSLLPLLPLISARVADRSGKQFPVDGRYVADDFDSTPGNTLVAASDITLQDIGSDGFHTLVSASHPDHKVRIKSTDGWCDPDVKSYTGYLDTGYGKELFFYFFESRGSPSDDPVIMWINGGPGCSSSMGLFMELGPCRVNDNPKSPNDTYINPHSWNKNANVFFLDEPIGVGFSYAEHGQTVDTTEAAAKDVAAFVQIFFEHFKEFEGRDFHMSGESYGGRYLPLFASAVWDGNDDLIAANKTAINLKSVLIGNGVTDNLRLSESYYPYNCKIQPWMNHTILPISRCVDMAAELPKCHKLYTKHCIETHDYDQCDWATRYCSDKLDEEFFKAGLNPYDVSKKCTLEELSNTLCYSETEKINTYLDLPAVRELLGVDESIGKYAGCSGKVGNAFNQKLDRTGETWLYVGELVERGIRVLSYVGTFDFICNHIGNEWWVEALEWYGKKDYNAQEFVDWKVDGKVAGKFKSYGPLSHLKIYGAGHMVPLDKPVEASTMLDQWINAQSFA